MDQEMILEIKDLKIEIDSKNGRLFPVNTVSLSVPKGKVVGLIGESGCGKSLTAMSILGLLGRGIRVAEGSIRFQGQELTALPSREMKKIRGDRISMIFQEPMTSLNPVIPVGKQVEEVLKLHTRLTAADRKKKTMEMLKKVRIPAAEERYSVYPFQLSGGLRQRIMIAMAMICAPDLLIADEPTTALDVTVQSQILKLMGELKDQTGSSVLLITHNFGVVSEFCDFVNVMYLGEAAESASTDEIFEHPLHPYTRGLIRSVPQVGKNCEKLEDIAGAVPPLTAVPKGCRFCDRCPYASDRCRTEHPELKEVRPGHMVRCFREGEV